MHAENVAACEEGYRCVDAQLRGMLLERRHHERGRSSPEHLDHRHDRGVQDRHLALGIAAAHPRARRRATRPARCRATSPSGSVARAPATFAARGISSPATIRFPRSPVASATTPAKRPAIALPSTSRWRSAGWSATSAIWRWPRAGRSQRPRSSAASASRWSAAAPRDCRRRFSCAGSATRSR